MNAATNSTYGNSNLTNYLQQKTISATPLELVAMLYAKAVAEVREARKQLAARNIELRSKAISKACDVISELDGSLNMEAGGDFAQRLRALYRYCLVRLLDANLQQADGPLVEVLGLLATLSEGWEAIAQNAANTSPMPIAAAAGRWGAARETSDLSHSWTL